MSTFVQLIKLHVTLCTVVALTQSYRILQQLVIVVYGLSLRSYNVLVDTTFRPIAFPHMLTQCIIVY